jgi:hypothetical protein
MPKIGDIVVNVIVKTKRRHKKRRPYLILWTFGAPQEQSATAPTKKGTTVMNTLTETQFVEGTVQPTTKKGNPAEVQSPVFSSSNDAVIKVETAIDNPLGVKVSAVAPGAAQCLLTFDADLGDGVETVVLSADFTVIAGKAVGGTFVFGAPQEQPEPAPTPTP